MNNHRDQVRSSTGRRPAYTSGSDSYFVVSGAITYEMNERVIQVQEESGMSVSEVLRAALDAWLPEL